MTASGAAALVTAMLALPFVVAGIYWWRRAPSIATTRADAFREDGWWVAYPWPWQRTVRGVKFEAATLGVAALLMLVTAALLAAGVATY